MRTCTICGVEKPESEYYVSRRKKDDGTIRTNLYGWCKACHYERMEKSRNSPEGKERIRRESKRRYWEGGGREKAMAKTAERKAARLLEKANRPPRTEYTCSRCHQTKPIAEFYVYPNGNVHSHCLACHREIARAYAASERGRQKGKEWRKTHTRYRSGEKNWKPQGESRICPGCQREFPIAEFTMGASASTRCGECRRAYARAYYARTKVKRDADYASRKNGVVGKAIKGGAIPPVENLRCAYCGEAATGVARKAATSHAVIILPVCDQHKEGA